VSNYFETLYEDLRKAAAKIQQAHAPREVQGALYKVLVATHDWAQGKI